MQTSAAIVSADRRGRGRFLVEVVYMRSNIEKALCPQEESSPGPLVERKSQCPSERINGMITLGGVVREVAVSTLRSEAIVRRDCLEQCGFSRTIFSCEETDSRMKTEFFEMIDGGN